MALEMNEKNSMDLWQLLCNYWVQFPTAIFQFAHAKNLIICVQKFSTRKFWSRSIGNLSICRYMPKLIDSLLSTFVIDGFIETRDYLLFDKRLSKYEPKNQFELWSKLNCRQIEVKIRSKTV